MIHDLELAAANPASDWAARSRLWLSAGGLDSSRRKRRERNTQPLILCGHGVSLRVENGALVIRDGFTHHPQTQATYRYFRGDLALPARILLLDGSGSLSFDVLSWLGEQGVALARVKWTGEVATVASGSGYVADREKVDWQLTTRDDPAKRLAFSADLIRRKLHTSIATLKGSVPESRARERAIATATNGIARLSSADSITAVRSAEAQCASAYFAAWAGLSIPWTGTARHPVPEDWLTFKSRASLANGRKLKTVNASHPLNAMLNYAYAVQQARLHIQAVADGYDPTIGIMHHGRRGLPAFLFDLIEPERPVVDAAVLKFVTDHRFAAADFVIRSDGVCRLSPQLARIVAGLVA